MHSALSPDLGSAVTMPCFQIAGKVLESKVRLNSLVTTGAIHDVILSAPIPFVFKVLSYLKTKNSVTGMKEKLFG